MEQDWVAGGLEVWDAVSLCGMNSSLRIILELDSCGRVLASACPSPTHKRFLVVIPEIQHSSYCLLREEGSSMPLPYLVLAIEHDEHL